MGARSGIGRVRNIASVEARDVRGRRRGSEDRPGGADIVSRCDEPDIGDGVVTGERAARKGS